MKKFDIKSIAVGLVIGMIGASVVFVAEKTNQTTISEKKSDTVYAAAAGIKSATISNDKVYFNGKEIKLEKPLVRVVKDGSSKAELYMPMNELLEYMNFKVEWDSKVDSVYLTMNGQNNQKNVEIAPNISKNEADAKAIETIQKTGNWGYIENLLPHMSSDGIEKVVEIYNSKHTNVSEHKKSCNYIKNSSSCY